MTVDVDEHVPPRLSVPVPAHMAGLHRDERGYIVPWFVHWQDGKPLFPVLDPIKWSRAVKASRCWICGGPLGAHKVFVVGPMCCVNRVSAEPPSHQACAEYAVQVCPFLANPRMRRVPIEKVAPEHAEEGAPVGGIMVETNPGIMALWFTRTYRVKNTPTGPVVVMGAPERVTWWTEGRRAEAAEVREGFEAGVERLLKLQGELDGPAALPELEKLVRVARRELNLER